LACFLDCELSSSASSLQEDANKHRQDAWVAEAVLYVEKRLHSMQDTGTSAYEVVHDVVRQAASIDRKQGLSSQSAINDSDKIQTKDSAVVPATSQSFSLFATVNNYVHPPPLLDFDRLETLSLPKQLELLQASPLEDLLPEWEIIADTIVWSGLQDLCLCTKFLDLIEQWVLRECHGLDDGSRSLVQSALCPHVLKVLQACHDDDDETNNAVTYDASTVDRILRIVWNVWMDWMMNLASKPIPLTAILSTALLDWHSSSASKRLQQAWMALDPFAMWLRAWVSCSDVTATICRSHPGFMENSWKAVIIVETDGTFQRNQSADGRNDELMTYHLCILYALLVSLRVSSFPWERVLTTTRSATDVEAIQMLLDAYIDYNLKEAADDTASTPSSSSSGLQEQEQLLQLKLAMARDAILTIVSGCHINRQRVYRTTVERLSQTPQTKSTSQLLRRLLEIAD
jgi:hypothetical protein